MSDVTMHHDAIRGGRPTTSAREDETLLRVRGSCLVVALSIAATLSWIPGSGSGASTAVLAGGGSKATCKQLPKSQIQALLSVPIQKVKITAALQTGQQCVYSGPGDAEDIDVLVIKGGEAKPGFQEDVKGLSSKVAVPGVGDKAYREKGDYQIESIKGNEYCSVSVGSEDSVPGVSALEVNGTSEIPERANAIVASALGTLCNRLYGTGNTKPSLKGLAALAPAATGS